MPEAVQPGTVYEARQRYAFWRGFGTDSDNWTADQLTEIKRIVNAGYKGLYLKPSGGYRWSWLKPTRQISTIPNSDKVDLPPHFAGINGRLTFAPGQPQYGFVTLTGENTLRGYQSGAAANTIGIPRWAAVRPKQPSTVTSQRWEMLFYPKPDGEYVLQFQMLCGSFDLDDNNPIPLGDDFELLIESILATGELMIHDNRQGPHRAEYEDRLATAISLDTSLRQPETLGYNGDGSEVEGPFYDRCAGVVRGGPVIP